MERLPAVSRVPFVPENSCRMAFESDSSAGRMRPAPCSPGRDREAVNGIGRDSIGGPPRGPSGRQGLPWRRRSPARTSSRPGAGVGERIRRRSRDEGVGVGVGVGGGEGGRVRPTGGSARRVTDGRRGNGGAEHPARRRGARGPSPPSTAAPATARDEDRARGDDEPAGGGGCGPIGRLRPPPASTTRGRDLGGSARAATDIVVASAGDLDGRGGIGPTAALAATTGTPDAGTGNRPASIARVLRRARSPTRGPRVTQAGVRVEGRGEGTSSKWTFRGPGPPSRAGTAARSRVVEARSANDASRRGVGGTGQAGVDEGAERPDVGSVRRRVAGKAFRSEV